MIQPKTQAFADYIKPLRPVLTTLGTRLPGISDIFGRDITLAKLAEDEDIKRLLRLLPGFKGKIDGAQLTKWVEMAQASGSLRGNASR